MVNRLSLYTVKNCYETTGILLLWTALAIRGAVLLTLPALPS